MLCYAMLRLVAAFASDAAAGPMLRVGAPQPKKAAATKRKKKGKAGRPSSAGEAEAASPWLLARRAGVGVELLCARRWRP